MKNDPTKPSKDGESLLKRPPPVTERMLEVISHDGMYFKTKAGFMEAGDPPVETKCFFCGSGFYVPAKYDPTDPEAELKCRFCGRVQPRSGVDPKVRPLRG